MRDWGAGNWGDWGDWGAGNWGDWGDWGAGNCRKGLWILRVKWEKNYFGEI